MEITFNKTVYPCLRKVISQTQTQEQTQEVRLPESMPDIGRVLDSWGQVLIRSKEWRGNAMTVSGGVMVWVLYVPEDGVHAQSVETWIPFQMRWDFPQTQRDGTICILPLLKSVDARSTSARKLMVRVNTSLLGEALEPIEAEIGIPEQVPEDVQLRKVTYPLDLPQESGEKMVSVEEDLTLPGMLPEMNRLLRYGLTPKILEQKVMAGRLVFRGKCGLHVLYLGEDGIVHVWDTEIPFSQYADLDRDYGAGSACTTIPVVTNLELIHEEHRLQLKCNIAAQYRIFDRVLAEIAEDAYSPARQVKMQMEPVTMPIRLDQREDLLQMSSQWNGDAERIADVSCLIDHPQQRQEADVVQMVIPMQFQMLYYDAAGNLQSGSVRCEHTAGIESDPGNRIDAYVQADGWPQSVLAGPNAQLTAQCQVMTDTFAEQGLTMISSLSVGEKTEPDPNRPSLILRRKETATLWDIAKSCGSTVDAIRQANGLQEEPQADQLLLIPIL